MYRNKTARQHNFATVPRADIPRSKFRMRQTRKQSFDASDLIPIMCEEILPGDTWQHTEHTMARLATPIAPAVDDIDLETFYFFVPNRLTWPGEDSESGWEAFITGREDLTLLHCEPTSSDGSTTQVIANGVLDHFGIPPATYTADALTINALPILAYFLIWNEWFRDQNLQDEYILPQTQNFETADMNNGTGAWGQLPLRINKRHDYFTSSLPFAQKGPAVTLPLGSTAPVTISAVAPFAPTFTNQTGTTNYGLLIHNDSNDNVQTEFSSAVEENLAWGNPALGGTVDLAAATASTINAIRLAFQTQKLLERDARGGSRYVEQLLAHFGVRSPDYRLQRPEYLGGSKIPVTVNPIAQTAAYDAQPDPTEASAIGNLGAEMHASGSKRTFTYAAVEHGYIIGLAALRATPTYQQGLRRHWNRQTRLDYYFPVFAMLGEQAVRTQEIFLPTTNNPTVATWGYQERWAEYRYTPNEITGQMRSTFAQPLDWWHYAEEFSAEPALNAAFITDKTKETLARSLATAPTEQWSAQIILDILHDSQVGRMMPTYSVPGLIDHF